MIPSEGVVSTILVPLTGRDAQPGKSGKGTSPGSGQMIISGLHALLVQGEPRMLHGLEDLASPLPGSAHVGKIIPLSPRYS